jgi:hypothetical protein
MIKVFVINFDEAIIFKTNIDCQFYNEQYQTFDEAKEQLISYWDNVLAEAKNNLKQVKKLKITNVQELP